MLPLAEGKEEVTTAVNKTHDPHLGRVNLVGQAVPPYKQLVDIWILELGNHAAPLRKLVKGAGSF